LARFRVASAGEVPDDSIKRVYLPASAEAARSAGGAPRIQICLAHAEDGNFYALNDICTHEEFNLSDGELWGMDVECPQHGSRFNLVTGKVTGLPAVIPATTYPVTVDGGEVYVEVPD
jgi:3-phenylpropionate/trans-cinnamate dioxygenase ferredoxin component